MIQRWWWAISCSIWAGLSIGVIEAFSLLLGVGAGEYDALFFAGLGYAILGGLLGLCWSWMLLLPIMDTISKFWLWSIGFLSVFSLLAYWIFHPSMFWFCLWPIIAWLQQIILHRTPLRVILTPKGSFGFLAMILLILAVFSLTPSRNIYTPPSHMQSAGNRPNILIVLVDGLRQKDGIQPQTPALQALKKQGIAFESAFSNAPTRYHSIAQMFTGQPVDRHPPLAEEYTTLAEHLSWHGYHSIALMNDADLGRFSNLHQGFDRYRYLPPLVHQDSTNWGLQYINEGTRKLRLFAWLLPKINEFNSQPSQYYRSAQDMVQQLEREIVQAPQERPWFAVLHFRDTQWPLFLGEDNPQLIQPNMSVQQQEKAYRQALNNIDRSLSQLWAFLQNQQEFHQSIVVLTAPFQIDLTSRSNRHPHPQQLAIPLLLKVPSVPSKVIRNNVQLMDLPNTLMSLVNIPEVPNWSGQNMFRLPPIGDNRVILGAYHPNNGPQWISAQQGNWRYIRWNGEEALYNVQEDPLWEHNQIQIQPEQYKELMEVINVQEHR